MYVRCGIFGGVATHLMVVLQSFQLLLRPNAPFNTAIASPKQSWKLWLNFTRSTPLSRHGNVVLKSPQTYPLVHSPQFNFTPVCTPQSNISPRVHQHIPQSTVPSTITIHSPLSTQSTPQSTIHCSQPHLAHPDCCVIFRWPQGRSRSLDAGRPNDSAEW